MAAILDSSTVILFNVYLILGLQLAFNWNKTGCNTSSYLFQLGFIVLMFIRLFFYEFHNNRVCGRIVNGVFMFLLDILLVALAVYQIFTMANNTNEFYYNPDTKMGNEVCFQNRIVFSIEIAVIFLTLIKDIYFICCKPKDDV